MICIISQSSIEEYNEKYGTNYVWDTDIDDDTFLKICKEFENEWSFNSWDDFVKEFNDDGNYAPMSGEHYIRVIER